MLEVLVKKKTEVLSKILKQTCLCRTVLLFVIVSCLFLNSLRRTGSIVI